MPRRRWAGILVIAEHNYLFAMRGSEKPKFDDTNVRQKLTSLMKECIARDVVAT
jgi:hypothetical protein